MSILEEEPQLFWGKAFAWIFGLGGCGVMLLTLAGRSSTAAGFAIGVATLAGILYFYKQVTVRFARPGVPSEAFQRVLLFFALLKYPLMLLIVYLVYRQGMEALVGFLFGIGLPLIIFTGLAIGNWKVPKKEG